MARQITISYTAVDGFKEARSFKTLAGARRYAHQRVGANPEMGTYYAVSGDGVGKVTVLGSVKLDDLFPAQVLENALSAQYILGRPMSEAEHEMFADFEGSHESFKEYISNMYHSRRFGGCTCSEAQLAHVGCDCAQAHAGETPHFEMPF